WIEGATGIRERRWAETETTVADLAVLAVQDCLRSSQIIPGMIIVASGTAKPGFPGPAAEVAARLGYEGLPALDVPMGRAGSLFGMALASKMVESYGDVLVIGAEKMSAAIQTLEDPNTAILFGDGAGAALISNRPGRWRILSSILHSDGQFRHELTYDGVSKL